MNGAVVYYTLEEISKNNGKDGNRVWIIYKDSVYDVTDYVDEHPGGAELVTEWAGKDATKGFDDFGHSGDAKKMMKQYKIGEVAEVDRKNNNNKSQVKTNGVQNGVKNGLKNGVKAKSLNSPDVRYRRSCISIITCGLLG